MNAPDRYDAAIKVRGEAVYAAEHRLPNVAHACVVQSTVACGRVRRIHVEGALGLPGVLFILTPDNMPRLTMPDTKQRRQMGEDRLPLQDADIRYAGQHVAVIVADRLEQAQEAASHVWVEYDATAPALSLETVAVTDRPAEFFGMPAQYSRGDVTNGLGGAAVRHAATYETPVEHHNPMEPHATIASWSDGRLTLYDSTQGVVLLKTLMAAVLGLSSEDVHVISPYVGGGFGCKGFLWPRPILAAVAARRAQRPVKLALTRDQMFTSNGHRAATIQSVELGADRGGKLIALRHAVRTHGSTSGPFFEAAAVPTPRLYACPNLEISHKVVALNFGSPTAMRAPGEASGSFAIESALDELAHLAGLDPVELRVRNHADADPVDGRAWSGKHLLECYRIGAERFRWSARTADPGSRVEGRDRIGFGMATATYPANRNPASAAVRIFPDGRVEARCASQDLGTGAYTVVASIVADTLDIPVDRVLVRLGDTTLPPGPLSGGSSTTASIGPAVQAAALKVRAALANRAGRDVTAPIPLSELASSLREAFIEETVSLDPTGIDAAPPFAWHSFGAHFVEVRVDRDLPVVRVTRVLSVMDVGRVISSTTARNQIEGAVVWGIGMALMERTVYDPRSGRVATASLADYLVPTNADAPHVDVVFLDRPDTHFNALGARGLGEIGIVGVAAAVANAVFNATGKRIRKLPILVEALL